MTKEQIQSLNLGITPIDDRAILIVESGIEWLKKNTTINCDDITALPPSARLFLVKFFDLNAIGAGVSSQSIEGLSLSFDTGNKSDIIWQFAEELLDPYLISRVRFVAASKKWR